jgi:hypothetical protein
MSFAYEYTWDYFPLFGKKQLTQPNAVSGNFTITTFPFWYKQITLEWAIPTDWGSCRFNVYKAQTEDGEYSLLNPTQLDPSINFFKDKADTSYSKIFRSWYKVEAVLSSGKRIQSLPVTWGNKRTSSLADLRSQEVQRREWLLLRKFVGVESYLFRRKTYGQRCTNCWHPQLEKIVKDDCSVCMGSSFEGGYFKGVSTLLQYEPVPGKLSLEYFGKYEPGETSAWTIAFPEIRPRDLVYKPSTGALYMIQDWADTELQTVTVRQILKLIELPKFSPEFKLISRDGLIPTAYQT